MFADTANLPFFEQLYDRDGLHQWEATQRLFSEAACPAWPRPTDSPGDLLAASHHLPAPALVNNASAPLLTAALFSLSHASLLHHHYRLCSGAAVSPDDVRRRVQVGSGARLSCRSRRRPSHCPADRRGRAPRQRLAGPRGPRHRRLQRYRSGDRPGPVRHGGHRLPPRPRRRQGRDGGRGHPPQSPRQQRPPRSAPAGPRLPAVGEGLRGGLPGPLASAERPRLQRGGDGHTAGEDEGRLRDAARRQPPRALPPLPPSQADAVGGVHPAVQLPRGGGLLVLSRLLARPLRRLRSKEEGLSPRHRLRTVQRPPTSTPPTRSTAATAPTACTPSPSCRGASAPP